jgi:hypothetical protein
VCGLTGIYDRHARKVNEFIDYNHQEIIDGKEYVQSLDGAAIAKEIFSSCKIFVWQNQTSTDIDHSLLRKLFYHVMTMMMNSFRNLTLS